MRKRSLTIEGHRTSVSLEEAFWRELDAIARRRGLSLPKLVAEIDAERVADGARVGLASALRVYALNVVRGSSQETAAAAMDASR